MKQILSFCVIADACNVSVCWNTPVQCSVQASRDKRAATEECIRSKTIDGEAEQSQDHPAQEAAAGGVVGINTKPIVLNTETNSMQIILAWLPQMLCFFWQQLQISMNIAVFSSKML